MGSLSPWHWAIIAVVLLVLFGAKKLPDFARSVGKSARILKEETKQFREESDNSSPSQTAAPQQLPPTTQQSDARIAPPIEQQRQAPHNNS